MEYNNKYGLVIPTKKSLFQKSKPAQNSVKPRLSIFNDDASSDEEGQKEVNSQIHKEAMKKIMKKQTKLEIQKALEEDATVYEYDSIYDDMKDKANKKNIPEKVINADQQKKPKYIGGLLKAAQKRNLERQRVEERKIEKERQKEGDEFNDKPQFVTSAYRKRMQERQEEEEEERKMAAIEDAMDVRKQKDLSGFYKHFLMRQMGEEALPGEKDSITSKVNSDKSDLDPKTQPNDEDRDTDLSFSSSEDEEQTHENVSSDSSSHNRSASPVSKTNRDETKESSSSDFRRSEMKHRRGERRSRNKHDKSTRSSSDRSPSRRSHHKEKSDRSRSERLEHKRSYKHRNTSDSPTRSRERRRHQSNDRSRESSDGKDIQNNISNKSPSRKRKHGDKSVDKNGKSSNQTEVTSEKFVKRTNTDSAMSARERYLARKKAMKAVPATVESDSN